MKINIDAPRKPCAHLNMTEVVDGNGVVMFCKDCGFRFGYTPDMVVKTSGVIQEALSSGYPPLVSGYLGWGDTFWVRPIIRKLADIFGVAYNVSALPDFWWDDKRIRCVMPYTNLHTQKKVIQEADPGEWYKVPKDYADISLSYEKAYHAKLEDGVTILSALEAGVGISLGDDVDFHFPVRPEWEELARSQLPKSRKPICVVKQGTVRSEWQNPARSCKDEYIQHLIDRHKKDFFFVSVGDNAPGREWPLVQLENVDCRLENGQLNLYEILGLIGIATITLGSQCFLLPASLATKTPTFAIYGGWVHPQRVMDRRLDPHRRLYGEVYPTPFCDCRNANHDCDAEKAECGTAGKDIPVDKLDAAFDDFLERAF